MTGITGDNLTGMVNEWGNDKGFFGPLELRGRAMIEHDIALIAAGVLMPNIDVTQNTKSELGHIASEINTQLADPNNWWVSRPAPIIISSLDVSANAITIANGVSVLRDPKNKFGVKANISYMLAHEPTETTGNVVVPDALGAA